jgi:Fe-S-cluster containining protein
LATGERLVNMSNARILRNHSLKPFAELKVGDDVFKTRYEKDCSMSNCRGRCCVDGVDLDIVERDRIIEHANLIQPCMDETQDRNPQNWFETTHPDADFSSGECATTSLKENGCVFLNKDGRCVVHIAESQMSQGFGYLKPFFCRAFPVCIVNGTLCVDDEQCPDEHKCCGPVKNGPLTILDVCAAELEFMLGANGLAELRTMMRERVSRHQKALL